MCNPHLRGQKLSFTYLQVEYLNHLKFFCMKYVSVFSLFYFIQSFIYVGVDHAFSFVFIMGNKFYFLLSSKELIGTSLYVLKTNIPNISLVHSIIAP